MELLEKARDKVASIFPIETGKRAEVANAKAEPPLEPRPETLPPSKYGRKRERERRLC